MGALESCTAHNNTEAISAQGISGNITDIDEAALQAIQHGIGDANKAALQQCIQLSFALENLPNLDTFSKTDAFIILYELKKGQGNNTMKVRVGRTECIFDNLNPVFVTNFDINYQFEETQTFLIEAWDVDDKSQMENLKAQEFIGTVEFQLHQVVTAKDQCYSTPVVNPTRKKNGILKITAEEKKQEAGELVLLKLKGSLKDTGKLFFIIWKQLSPKKYKPVFKSEIQSQNRGHQCWNELSIDTNSLCNSEPDQEIKIDFYRSAASGNHKHLGTCYTDLRSLKDGQKEMEFKKQTIAIESFQVKKACNFLEYVFGGCDINLEIAIDFTLSNGDPSSGDSLHNKNPQRNEYLQALRAVGNVLQYYDSDKEIPAYGFGAQVPPAKGRASHCFALNGDIFAPECNALEGVVQAYQNALSKVALYGPTHFSEILAEINGRCEQIEISSYNQEYHILMIITDGIINDMQKTIDEVVRGSNLPLSIVIVGVGDADFDSMDQLDADEEPLYSKKYRKYMARDIVQFVPFREFKNNAYLLAKETLQEIPGQVVDFFVKRNIYPKASKEDDRKRIQAQLSLKSKMDPNKKLDQFQEAKKHELIDRVTEMGLDTFAVQDLLEEKGICENSVNLVLDLMQQPGYVNALKPQQVMQPVPQYGMPPQQLGMPPQMQRPPQGLQPQQYQQQPQYGGQLAPPQGGPPLRSANTQAFAPQQPQNMAYGYFDPQSQQ